MLEEKRVEGLEDRLVPAVPRARAADGGERAADLPLQKTSVGLKRRQGVEEVSHLRAHPPLLPGSAEDDAIRLEHVLRGGDGGVEDPRVEMGGFVADDGILDAIHGNICTLDLRIERKTGRASVERMSRRRGDYRVRREVTGACRNEHPRREEVRLAMSRSRRVWTFRGRT